MVNCVSILEAEITLCHDEIVIVISTCLKSYAFFC